MVYSAPDPPLPIKLVSLTNKATPEQKIQSSRRTGRPTRIKTPTDLRWMKVEEFLRSVGLSANTRKSYERELKSFLNWTELNFAELRSRHLGQYKAYLMEEFVSEQGKPLSKSSINAALTALKSFFNWFSLTYPELLTTNPTIGIKFEKIPLPPAQSLTAEEMERVWQALDSLGETKERDSALIHLLNHGLRAGEVVALNLGAFDGRLLFLADTKNNEPRLVPLRSGSRAVLQAYLQGRESQGEVLAQDHPLILSHHSLRKGERLSYHGIYFAIEKIGKIAGISGLHPHQFRHTYATELLLLGVDPTHAKRLTGHRSEQAFRRYTLRSEQEAAIAAYYRAIQEEPSGEEK